MAVKQYPHYLYVKNIVNATRDSNGVFVPGLISWEYVGKCRFESNGKGTEIKTDDSKTVLFSGVAFSQEKTIINNDTQVLITRNEMKLTDITQQFIDGWTKNNNVVIVGINLKTDNTQLHTKYYIN